jgi:hypothetical protein
MTAANLDQVMSGALIVVESVPVRHPLHELATKDRNSGDPLEAAKREWRAGLRARMNAVEAMLSGVNVTELPTPVIDGDE